MRLRESLRGHPPRHDFDVGRVGPQRIGNRPIQSQHSLGLAKRPEQKVCVFAAANLAELAIQWRANYAVIKINLSLMQRCFGRRHGSLQSLSTHFDCADVLYRDISRGIGLRKLCLRL